MADVAERRKFFAQLMAVASGWNDPRFGQAIEQVPREDFMGPGPWQVYVIGGGYVETPSSDPGYLYQDALVALDAEQGINNGQPTLHARWIGAVKPRPGEIVSHVGAGTGYYTAILAKLVEPGGHVHAYEIDQHLAGQARRYLAAYDNVNVVPASAVTEPLPQSDIVYVNASVQVPPVTWLTALREGGRMVFPWRLPRAQGLAVVVFRHAAGFAASALMPSLFIPCQGVEEAHDPIQSPGRTEAWAINSLHLCSDRAPDDSAVAVYDDVWFSRAPLST